MKNLYSDIIYFIQNHVKLVPGHGHTFIDEAPKIMQMASSLQFGKVSEIQNRKDGGEANCSVILTEEPSIKLFGVSLSGKKRLHQEKIDQEEIECGISYSFRRDGVWIFNLIIKREYVLITKML